MIYVYLYMCIRSTCAMCVSTMHPVPPMHYTSVGFTCLALPLLVIRALSTAMAFNARQSYHHDKSRKPFEWHSTGLSVAKLWIHDLQMVAL